MDNSFPTVLREFRMRTRRSQSDLSKEVGIHQCYWSLLESGRRQPPSQQVVERMSTVLRLNGRDADLLMAAAGYFPWNFYDDTEYLQAASMAASILSSKKISDESKQEFAQAIRAMSERILRRGI